MGNTTIDPNAPADDDGTGTGEGAGTGTDDGAGTGTGGEGGEGGKAGAADETVSKAEFDKVFARMQAADRAKNDAETKLREKEQAELGELDRAKVQLEEQKARADEAEKELKKTLIENAFHRENKHTWHDVADAIAALDMSLVEVADDGKVTGMAKAIEGVAKSKPHYVKNDDGSGPPAANGANNGKRKGEGETPDRATLAKRFPALNK